MLTLDSAEGGGETGWEGGDEGELTEIGEADQEIGDEEAGGAVEAVGGFFGEGGAVFEEGGHVGDGHEGHEGGAEELGHSSQKRVLREEDRTYETYDCVDKGLYVLLSRAQSQPHSPHHDRETYVISVAILPTPTEGSRTNIHGKANPISNHIPIALDEIPMQQSDWDEQPRRARPLAKSQFLVLVVRWRIGCRYDFQRPRRTAPCSRDAIKPFVCGRVTSCKVHVDQIK